MIDQLCPSKKETLVNELKVSNLDTLNISYGKTVKPPVEIRPFSTILQIIRTGDGIKEAIKTIRACTNDDKRRELKRDLLPWFNMGLFTNGRRKDEKLQCTRHIIIDYDHLNGKTEELKKQLQLDTSVFSTFISPGGDGLKVIYELASEITDPDEYTRVYQYYAAKFSEQYGFEADHTSDVSRACFLSYDPDIYVNTKNLCLPTDVKIEEDKPTKQPAKKEELLKSFAGAESGNRTHSATQLIGMHISKGFDREFTIEHLRVWNKQNIPPLPDDKIVYTVNDMYNRYEEQTKSLPVQFVIKNNSYLKKDNNKIMTTFTIEPKELLVLDDSDCLKCDVISAQGYTYPNIHIENTDWHSKAKLLKAIGHQDCTFHGTDNDIQILCSYVNTSVPVRKKGTRVIGLLTNEQTWVTNGLNITKEKISYDPEIISYDKGKNAFYYGISYAQVTDAEYSIFISGLYNDITRINEETIIVPWLGWIFATPIKPILLDCVGGFPLAFVHGTQGGGKTSSAKVLKRLCGYIDPKPHSCKEKAFPLLKLISSTNAIPVLLDEFKSKLLTEDQMNNIIAYMNKAYSGETESKGQADQRTKDYEILAPLCVMGEWNITVPSVHERILVIRVKDTVKKNKSMQEAFDRVRQLHLEAFMPRYIQFCLNQDIPKMFEEAKCIVEKHFGSKMIAPRIVDNLSVMVLGIELFKQFGLTNHVNLPTIDMPTVLNHQLREITGSNSGFVQSAVDQLMNELSVMAMKEKEFPVPNGFDCKVRKDLDYKEMLVKNKETNASIKVLAINFTKIFPDFKQYAKQTSYEGDLLDKESYLRLFDESNYVYSKEHPVKFNGKTVRSLCVDIKKAQEAGIDFEGFGIE